jgi:hypothetical protein
MFKNLIFNFRFDSKTHVLEYVTLVDSLIQQGKDRLFDSEQPFDEACNAGTCPTVDTSNHIRMMYSIVNSSEGFEHHFSLSRNPHYLASLHAKHLTALFCNLSGLAVHDVLFRSKQAIYHSGHILNQTEQELFETYANPDRDDPNTLFSKAFMDSIPIKIESADW